MSTPTLILTPLLALVLLLAFVQVGRMAQGWLAARRSGRSELERRDRIALLDEKERVLMELHDIAFEHRMGRLSDADFQQMKTRFELRAVELIEALEALEP